MLLVVGVVSAALISFAYDLNIVILAPNYNDYFDYYLTKPYCRVAPYAFGIASAFIYFTSNNEENSDVVSKLILKLFDNIYLRLA